MSKGIPPQFQIGKCEKKKHHMFLYVLFSEVFFLKPIIMKPKKGVKTQHEITMMLTGSITITYK